MMKHLFFVSLKVGKMYSLVTRKFSYFSPSFFTLRCAQKGRSRKLNSEGRIPSTPHQSPFKISPIPFPKSLMKSKYV